MNTDQILEQARKEISEKDALIEDLIVASGGKELMTAKIKNLESENKRLIERIAELEERLKNTTDLYNKFEQIALYLFEKLADGEELEATLYKKADGYEWTIANPDTGETVIDDDWFNAVEKLMKGGA